MDSASRLLRLFSYDKWANKQVVVTLRENMPFEGKDKSSKLFAHIGGAQELWFRRIKGDTTDTLQVWPDYTLTTTFEKLKTLTADWKQLLKSNSSNLDKQISYHNSKGKRYQTMLSDILHHVIIHGQHHRAQIAKLLRNAKIEPPATDFIFFCRAN